jgi:hypothetical protein
MHSFLLQDWITIRGAASQTVAQGEVGWLDLAPYEDIMFWFDVREFSTAATTFNFQTAPTKEEILFTTMVTGTVSLTPSNPYVNRITATTPLARFVRWQLVGPASAWDATFRVLVAANALGM